MLLTTRPSWPAGDPVLGSGWWCGGHRRGFSGPVPVQQEGTPDAHLCGGVCLLRSLPHLVPAERRDQTRALLLQFCSGLLGGYAVQPPGPQCQVGPCLTLRYDVQSQTQSWMAEYCLCLSEMQCKVGLSLDQLQPKLSCTALGGRMYAHSFSSI